MTQLRETASPPKSIPATDRDNRSLEARLRQTEEALRRSEEKLRVALSAAKLGTWERDLRTGEFTASAACKANLGLPADAPLTFEHLQAMRHPEDLGRVTQAIQTAIANKEDYDVEYRVMRPDGSIGRIIARGHAVYENGQPIRMIGVTLDVTERERHREVLQNLERRQRFLLNLNDRLRTIDEPLAIIELVSAMLGDHFGVDRAGYGEIDQDDNLVIEREWSRGFMRGGPGVYPLIAFGPRLLADLAAGKTLQIGDIRADPRTAAARDAFDAIDVRAMVTIPLVKARRLTAILYIHLKEAHAWSDDDASLLEDVAERTWAAIERARAEADLRVSESRFRTIAEALPALVWILGTDLKLTYANERWIRYAGLTPESALGYSWMEAFHPDDLQRVIVDSERLIREESDYTAEARYRSLDGEYRWHVIQAEPLRNARGEFVGWCGASVDIHDRKVAEAALQESAERLRLALQAARMGDWSWDADTDLVTLSDRAAEILGQTSGSSTSWADLQSLLHEKDLSRAREAMEKAASTGDPYNIEARLARATSGAETWVAAKGQVTRRPDGSIQGMIGVVQDISERKHAEERQQLLIRELHHRVKNTLATVQAIVSSTARTASSIDEFYQGFVGRVVSLAHTHNLLTDDLWQKASLDELLRAELGPYEDRDTARIALEGPVVELPSEAAVPIGMAIHELTTNAAKHGALSAPGGRVHVRWSVEPRPERPVLHFAWTERGGPPVAAPARQGFGSRLLKRVLTSQLEADVQMDFPSNGLRFTMQMPMPKAAALLNPLQ